MILKIRPLGRCHSLKISAHLLSLLGPRLCSARLGATSVRFTMPRRAPVRSPLLLLALSLLAPAPAAAQSQNNSPYGPLPVFELHSGFWINLHHTLYHEARLRTTAGSHDKSGKSSSGPTLNAAPDAKPALTSPEQHIWDDAVAYYVANYAAKDLLFSTELIQLKDQLGDFEDCDELSGRKRKFCDAGLPATLTQAWEAAEPVQAAITRECRQRDKAIPRDLWHALVFYTTGEVIRPVLGTSGSTAGDQEDSVPGGSYTPYAVREGLYQRGWSDYFKLLQKFWQPYLDGTASFDDAIARMVSSL